MTRRDKWHIYTWVLCALETTVHEAAEHKATNLVTETGGAYRTSRNVGNQLRKISQDSEGSTARTLKLALNWHEVWRTKSKNLWCPT